MPRAITNGSTDVSLYFVMRDSTNHAPKTDVTITDIDIYYQEQGAAQSAKADLTALAAADSAHADNKGFHCGNGLYRIDWPDAAFDGGMSKTVILVVVCSGCDTIYREIQLSPPVDVVTVEGTDATNQIRDAVVDDATRIDASALNTLSSHDPGEAIMGATDLGTGSGFTALASATNLATLAGYVDTEVAAIKAKTDNLPASPAAVGSQMDLVNAPNATAVTAIQSGLATAAALDAVDNFVDTEVGAIKAVTDKLDTALELDGAVYRYTTNALEQASGTGATAQQVWEYTTRSLTDKAGFGLADDAITSAKFDETTAYPLTSADTGATAVARTGADSDTLETLSDQLDGLATNGEVADAILDEALSGHTTAGTLGKAIADILADTGTDGVQVAGIKAAALADLFDTDSGTTYASAVSGSVVKEIADNAGGSALTAGAIADAVWDEATADHSDVGSTGAAITAAGSAGDPWATALPGSYGAGTAGKIVGDNINAPIGTVDAVVDAIKAKTDSLTFTVAGDVDVNVQTWKGSTAPAMTGDAYARLGAPAGASVSADVAAVKSETAAIVADTNELQTNQGNWATATGFSTHSAADVKTAIEAAGSHLTLIKAKTDNLPSDPADQSAVEAAITAAHSTTNGKIDAVDDFVDTEVAAILAAVDTEVAAIKAKTDNLPASPAAVGSAMTLHADYDAAKTAATQASVNTIGGIVDDILEDTGTTIPAAITALTEAGVKKNTALSGFTFYMTDSTNHEKATGLTVTAERSLDGAAFAACANAVAELSDGCYKIDLADTDLNADVVALKFTATDADDLVITIRTSA